MAFNVVYIGSSGRGCDYINCHPDFNVVAVICQKKMVNDDLLTCCYTRDIPLFEIECYCELKNILTENAAQFDFAIMFIFSLILKTDLLDNLNVYNIHISYLPFYKGRNCTFFATLNGEKRIGISLHKVVPKVDEGLIISRKSMPYYFWMGEEALREAAVAQIPNLLTDLVTYFNNPDYKTIDNNNSDYYPPINTSMLEINEETPVKDILNIIRSQDCYNGGRFIYKGTTYLIKEAKVSMINKINEEDLETNRRVFLKNGEPFGIKINDNYYLKLKTNRTISHN